MSARSGNACWLLVVGVLQVRLDAGPAVLARCAATAMLMLLVALLPLAAAVVAMGGLLAGLVAVEVVAAHRAAAAGVG